MVEEKHIAASLIEKRYQIAREIKDLTLQIEEKRNQLLHIDNTIAILDPDAIIETETPDRRIPRKMGYFARGEIARRCLAALREANGEPVAIMDITIKAMRDKRLDPNNNPLRKKFYHSFMMSMHDQCRRVGSVERIGRYRDVKWKLAD